MGSIHAVKGDVAFDFSDALILARQLWALADQVDALTSTRQALAGETRVGFSGTYAAQFTSRIAEEASNAATLSAHLRADAAECAQGWQEAMEEENRRLYAQHIDQIKRQRSTLQTIWDDVHGFHGYGREPDPVAQPQPPAFAPTAEPVRYQGP